MPEPEMCLASHRAISASKGTKACARRAIETGIPTYLIDTDAAVPKRLLVGAFYSAWRKMG
jgi:hypothetical protein